MKIETFNPRKKTMRNPENNHNKCEILMALILVGFLNSKTVKIIAGIIFVIAVNKNR